MKWDTMGWRERGNGVEENVGIGMVLERRGNGTVVEAVGIE